MGTVMSLHKALSSSTCHIHSCTSHPGDRAGATNAIGAPYHRDTQSFSSTWSSGSPQNPSAGWVGPPPASEEPGQVGREWHSRPSRPYPFRRKWDTAAKTLDQTGSRTSKGKVGTLGCSRRQRMCKSGSSHAKRGSGQFPVDSTQDDQGAWMQGPVRVKALVGTGMTLAAGDRAANTAATSDEEWGAPASAVSDLRGQGPCCPGILGRRPHGTAPMGSR